MSISVGFLMSVWGHACREGDYVCLSTKKASNKDWSDYSFPYDKSLRRNLREWFKKYSSSEYDLYFCPLPFSQAKRAKKSVSRFNMLWSDIDEGSPKLEPTYLWESSPGRLQGIWFLTEADILPEDGQYLNKALTYYMGADKGGWDLTQALRIPGTKNHKYSTLPSVRILERKEDLVYNPIKVAKRIGYSMEDPEKEVPITHTDNLTFERVFSKHRRRIPIKVRQLLTQKTVAEGNRSDVIWYLENKLNEAGLSAQEIICLIKHSAWNKFKGRQDEDKRLNAELEKIIESKISVKENEIVEKVTDEEVSTDLQVEGFYDIMTCTDSSPGWMVKGFWLNRSHGIVAGEPKSFKSTLALDLSVSVASGKPFLEKYEVVHSGPVVYIQNENAKWIMKDRVSKICAAKGIVGKVEVEGTKVKLEWAPEIPLYMVNQQSFLLSDPLHQDQLEQIIKSYEPSLVVLDPLYLMFDGDINSAKELSPVLQWLLDMRYRLNCGVMLIHHYNKGNGKDTRRGGQRMLGSTTLHGWTESAWYIRNDSNEELEDEDGGDEDINSELIEAQVTMEREFRGAGLYPKADLAIQMGEIGSFHYQARAQKHHEKANKEKDIPEGNKMEICMSEIKRTCKGQAVPENELVKRLGFSADTVRRAVDSLVSSQVASRNPEGVIVL